MEPKIHQLSQQQFPSYNYDLTDYLGALAFLETIFPSINLLTKLSMEFTTLVKNSLGAPSGPLELGGP